MLLKDSNPLGLEWKSPGSSSSLKYCRRLGSNCCPLAWQLGTLPLDQQILYILNFQHVNKVWISGLLGVNKLNFCCRNYSRNYMRKPFFFFYNWVHPRISRPSSGTVQRVVQIQMKDYLISWDFPLKFIKIFLVVVQNWKEEYILPNFLYFYC